MSTTQQVSCGRCGGGPFTVSELEESVEVSVLTRSDFGGTFVHPLCCPNCDDYSNLEVVGEPEFDVPGMMEEDQ